MKLYIPSVKTDSERYADFFESILTPIRSQMERDKSLSLNALSILIVTKMSHLLVRPTQRKVKWVGLAKHHAAGKAHYLDSVPDEKAFDA